MKIVARYRESAPSRPKSYRDKNGQQKGGGRQNGDDSTTFAVDFGVVVKARRIYTGERGRPTTEYYTEPWGFGQTAPSMDESLAGHEESTIPDPSMIRQL
jgi:hypothetical protein